MSSLTNTEVKVFLFLIAILIIDNIMSLITFYINYDTTDKFKIQKLNYYDKIRLIIATILYSITFFICLYFLLKKNTSSLFKIINVLVLLKVFTFFFLEYKFYKLFGIGLTPKSNKKIQDMRAYDKIFSNILIVIIGIYTYKLILL